jgi:sorting nexin-4
MIREFDIFQRARETELKQGLAAYADCHIDFYKKVICCTTIMSLHSLIIVI